MLRVKRITRHAHRTYSISTRSLVRPAIAASSGVSARYSKVHSSGKQSAWSPRYPVLRFVTQNNVELVAHTG
jgi:hypothetical protein